MRVTSKHKKDNYSSEAPTLRDLKVRSTRVRPTCHVPKPSAPTQDVAARESHSCCLVLCMQNSVAFGVWYSKQEHSRKAATGQAATWGTPVVRGLHWIPGGAVGTGVLGAEEVLGEPGVLGVIVVLGVVAVRGMQEK